MIDINVKVTVGMSDELAAVAAGLLAALDNLSGAGTRLTAAPLPTPAATPEKQPTAGVVFRDTQTTAAASQNATEAAETASTATPAPAATPIEDLAEQIRLIIEATRRRIQGENYQKGTPLHKKLTAQFKQLAESIHPGAKPTELASPAEVEAFRRGCDELNVEGDQITVSPQF